MKKGEQINSNTSMFLTSAVGPVRALQIAANTNSISSLKIGGTVFM